ncbi:MAG: nucleotidyl transferase AbiEii/AbiGii toxin family protein, partial [Methanocorpusculum sp.]|nr:nucleotidyl transferase AbiEii/AbiGii toxin family protein [Methanocorpusculum sp.]
MQNIARLPPEDRKDLFSGTSSKKGMSEAVIEKDFWVCIMLDYLFHECKWKDKFVFKGGTSLSKAYNLIERFSEDIDLILDWRVLGYSRNEPWEERSNKSQDDFCDKANERAELFLRDEFVPRLESDLIDKFGDGISVSIDELENQTVNVHYPQSYSDDSLLQEIRLEIGPLAAWTPSSVKQIEPYAAECYPKKFSQPSTDILTVLPERTFWEKVTILHSEAFRTNNLPPRYSRH